MFLHPTWSDRLKQNAAKDLELKCTENFYFCICYLYFCAIDTNNYNFYNIRPNV